LALVAREIGERRAVLWAAIVAGIVPFGSPLIPGVRADQVVEAREALAVLVACLYGVAAALFLGAGAVARDLAEGRLRFDFARPLTAGAIWAGRFLATLLLVALSAAIVLAPSALAGGGIAPLRGSSWPLGFLVAAGTVLFLVPAAHAAAVALRSRSAWLGLDLAGLLIVPLVVAAGSRRLTDAGAVEVALGLGLASAGGAVATLWLASAAQLSVGRTDLGRGHRIQSIVLWALLSLTALAHGAATIWVLAAGPLDLTSVAALPAPAGPWIAVEGEAIGRGDYRPAFLVHGEAGRVVRLGGAAPGTAAPWSVNLRFSSDGRRAVWLRPVDRAMSRLEVLMTDLDAAAPVARSTGIGWSPWATWAISEDGGRLAVLENGIVAVHALDTGKLEASVRVEGSTTWESSPLLRFATADTVRLFRFVPALTVDELDVPARTLTRVGEGPALPRWGARTFNRDGSRLVVDAGPDDATLVLEARTARVVASFPAPAVGHRSVRFLGDGRLLLGERRSGGSTIRIVSHHGVVERSIELAAPDLRGIGGEVEPGVVLLALAPVRPGEDWAASMRTARLDLASGASQEIGTGRYPLLAMAWFAAAAPGSPGTRLILRDGALVRWDPATGTEIVVAGRAGPR
jgi:hypothetical protein